MSITPGASTAPSGADYDDDDYDVVNAEQIEGVAADDDDENTEDVDEVASDDDAVRRASALAIALLRGKQGHLLRSLASPNSEINVCRTSRNRRSERLPVKRENGSSNRTGSSASASTKSGRSRTLWQLTLRYDRAIHGMTLVSLFCHRRGRALSTRLH